jgi:hypothetical protein
MSSSPGKINLEEMIRGLYIMLIHKKILCLLAKINLVIA